MACTEQMTKEQRDATLDCFEAEKISTGDGLLIRTLDIAKHERNAFHLGADGDYCLFVGPKFEATYTQYSNGTTQITIKRIEDSVD